MFADCAPPFRCCETVVAEACFLMRKCTHRVRLRLSPSEHVACTASRFPHWRGIEALLKKYADRPISLADACLIRCAEIHQEARIVTFDTDFTVYTWARNRKFELL
jgi:predicted nucleic acid-binding protein